MGGTVRIVTNQPQLKEFAANFQGIASYTDGGSANGGGNFMFNIPLGDTLALRLVGSDTYRSGWVDRIVVNPFPPDTAVRGNVLAAPVQSIATNVNTERMLTGRASLLFKPNDNLTIIASALYRRAIEFLEGTDPSEAKHALLVKILDDQSFLERRMNGGQHHWKS